jgi:kinesin family protein 2/24
MEEEPKIKVIIRKRPINRKELGRGEADIIDVHSGNQVRVRENKIKVDLTKYIEEQTFAFDHAFSETSTN